MLESERFRGIPVAGLAIKAILAARSSTFTVLAIRILMAALGVFLVCGDH